MAVSCSIRPSVNLRSPLSRTRDSDPHPIFVIVLVGPEEQPFGIQLDFLCFKSSHYRRHFAEQANADSLEHLVRLPDTPVEVFAFAQNFLFTGQVFPGVDNLPSYEILIGVWKLGHDLGIDGLCDATLEAMAECRRITQHIPATPLLVQVWQDTPKGSSIRKLLLGWAAEYIRSSQTPNDFADTLPKEILSELVVAMRSDTSPPASAPPTAGAAGQARRSVHYLEDEDAQDGPSKKRQRHSESLPNGSGLSAPTGPSGRKPLPSRPTVVLTQKGNVQKRRSVGSVNDLIFTNAQKLEFCADLLTRMLSGPGTYFFVPPLSLPAKGDAVGLTQTPGFWTRLVGPFKSPVNPVPDGVPDYLDKVDRPMDLGTMKDKMDRHAYADEDAFLTDMNQIFQNCFTYWKKGDPMWSSCEKLQKTFQEKYAQMNKWISKMDGDEAN